MANMLQNLARLITSRQKANPAGEGNWHPGPYTVNGGVIPAGSPWNFWQLDIDPVGCPSSAIVEACVWAYVRAIAQLPGYHRLELDNGGTETITTSALARLLRNPNPYQTPSDFLVHLIRSLLLNGNSYWIAQRNDRAEVTALHWTDPRQCCVREIGIRGQSYREVFYEISDNPLFEFQGLGPNSMVVPARDVFHVKLATPRHPLVGETWLAALATELGQTGAINNSLTQAAANQRPAGVITTDMTLTKPQVDELRARWTEQAQNMPAGGVPILTNGLKFQPLTMSASDQQVIDQKKLNDQMVAAVFGVPAILVGMGGGATQKSAEAVMAEWLAAGLGWLINHIEVAMDQFVDLNANSIGRGREYTEFDTRMLLRSAFKDRIDGLARAVQGGVYSPNEARRLEGLSDAEDGAEPRLQAQVVPLSAWDKVPAPSAPAAPAAPTKPDDAEPPEDDPASEDEKTALYSFSLKRELADARAA